MPEGFVVVAPDEEVVPSVPAAPPVVVVPAALPFVVVPSVDLPESVVVTPGSFVHATESIITPASIATAKRSVIILFIDIISFLDFLSLRIIKSVLIFFSIERLLYFIIPLLFCQ